MEEYEFSLHVRLRFAAFSKRDSAVLVARVESILRKLVPILMRNHGILMDFETTRTVVMVEPREPRR